MDANIAINCLNNNKMVANSKKFRLVFLARNKSIKKEMSFYGKAIKSSSPVELIGITLDKNLNFKSHTENICSKANDKISYFSNSKFSYTQTSKGFDREVYIIKL